MLYKFKSRATPDLIMLEPNGRRVLQLIGKPVDEKQGILQAADIPSAIAALEAAITQEEAARRAAEAEAAAKGEELPELEGVSLRQRATPFIDMLRRCEEAGKDIVWGV
jgi:regulator of protease activity HflC (stomatin/prohibitin superfamily)